MSYRDSPWIAVACGTYVARTGVHCAARAAVSESEARACVMASWSGSLLVRLRRGGLSACQVDLLAPGPQRGSAPGRAGLLMSRLAR